MAENVAGGVAIKKEGIVKELGYQSSSKKLIEFASGGSMAGVITTIVSTGVRPLPLQAFYMLQKSIPS